MASPGARAGSRGTGGTGLRSPANVRDVFAGNLRILSTRTASLTRLCAELGINRTQYNRYLSGEAYPRPDVLDRICRYFQCDARILLEPIAEINASQEHGLSPYLPVSAFARRMASFDHRKMPDGYYQLIRPASLDGPVALYSLMVLKSLPDGTKQALAEVPAFFFDIVGVRRTYRQRRQQSMLFQTGEGVFMLFASPYGENGHFAFVAPGFWGNTDTSSGYLSFFHPPDPMHGQCVPMVMQYLGPEVAAALAMRRLGQVRPVEALRPMVREYFATWNPLDPRLRISRKGEDAGAPAGLTRS